MKTSNGRFGRSKSILIASIGLLVFAIGCPQTNSDTYDEWESGESTLTNPLRRASIWVGGCNAFEQQRLENGEWVDQGGDIACLWEGFAQRIPPGEARADPFTARSPGTWRLNYSVGFGCQPDQPLSQAHCGTVSQITTNEFEVGTPNENEMLCNDSGGRWDLGSCGDYHCGTLPLCLALIPGCDCGPTANFVPGEGCVEDDACDPNQIAQQALCEDTGGLWDPLSCGNYSCGNRPECAAIIPGCNCGPNSVFDAELGCVAVPCGAPQG